MLITSLILAFVAALVILESLFVLIYPKEIKLITLRLIRNRERLTIAGITELIIGVLILIVSLFY